MLPSGTDPGSSVRSLCWHRGCQGGTVWTGPVSFWGPLEFPAFSPSPTGADGLSGGRWGWKGVRCWGLGPGEAQVLRSQMWPLGFVLRQRPRAPLGRCWVWGSEPGLRQLPERSGDQISVRGQSLRAQSRAFSEEPYRPSRLLIRGRGQHHGRRRSRGSKGWGVAGPCHSRWGASPSLPDFPSLARVCLHRRLQNTHPAIVTCSQRVSVAVCKQDVPCGAWGSQSGKAGIGGHGPS